MTDKITWLVPELQGRPSFESKDSTICDPLSVLDIAWFRGGWSWSPWGTGSQYVSSLFHCHSSTSKERKIM